MSHQMETFWFSIEAWILDNWINKEIKSRNWDAKRLLRFPMGKIQLSDHHIQIKTKRNSKFHKEEKEIAFFLLPNPACECLATNVWASLFPARRLIFSKWVWSYTNVAWPGLCWECWARLKLKPFSSPILSLVMPKFWLNNVQFIIPSWLIQTTNKTMEESLSFDIVGKINLYKILDQ